MCRDLPANEKINLSKLSMRKKRIMFARFVQPSYITMFKSKSSFCSKMPLNLKYLEMSQNSNNLSVPEKVQDGVSNILDK